jgi:hypothetical protein
VAPFIGFTLLYLKKITAYRTAKGAFNNHGYLLHDTCRDLTQQARPLELRRVKKNKLGNCLQAYPLF